jgi:hypothetical protein
VATRTKTIAKKKVAKKKAAKKAGEKRARKSAVAAKKRAKAKSRVKAQDRWTILLHVIERAGRPGNAQGATAGVFAEGGDLSMLTAEIGKNDEDPPDR